MSRLSPGERVLITVLVLFHVFVLFAKVMSPYDPTRQNREHAFLPPTRIHFQSDSGEWHLRPFVYALLMDDHGERRDDRSQRYPLQFFTRGDEYRLLGLLPLDIHLFGVESPVRVYLLGTDGFGRDQLSRLLIGAQVSLLAAIAATCVSLGLGAVLGSLAGFYGGWTDAVISRFGDLFMALPWLYLLFAVRAFLPLDIDPVQAWILLVSVIGFVGWARPARLIRGIALSVRERNFVLAARGFGASGFYLMRRHILPATWTVLLTQAALLVPQYVLAEATLSFVGLGIGEPTPSWGNMLAPLQQYYVLTNCQWMFIPIALLIAVFHGYFGVANIFHKRLKSSAT